MKIGDSIEKLLHESGEDIIVSYRTGRTALIENGKIKKIYTAETYQEIGWRRKEWEAAAIREAAERRQKEIDKAAQAADEYLKNI